MSVRVSSRITRVPGACCSNVGGEVEADGNSHLTKIIASSVAMQVASPLMNVVQALS